MITIRSTDLFNAVKKIKPTNSRWTEMRSPLPIFNHTLIEVTPNRVTVASATFTDKGFETLSESIPNSRYTAKAPESWEICVPSRTFRDALRIMAKDKDVVKMEIDTAALVLVAKTDNSTTRFKCMDARDFPPANGAQP
jgi:DNA polymerase III sliding clamp (beta) subunit (PCNA family)